MRLFNGFITFFLIFSLYSIYNGCQELYVNLTNQKPTDISCKDYILNGSSAKWVKINQCYIDNSEVVVVYDKNGDISTNSDFFIPIFADKIDVNSTEIKDINILLKVNSIDKKTIFQTYFNLEESKIKEYYKNHQKEWKFLIKKQVVPIQGKILFGSQGISENIKDALREKFRLLPNYTIINENEEPLSIVVSLCWLLGGLVLGFISIRSYTD